MIDWYEDNYIGIQFSCRPHVDILYPEPQMSKDNIEQIEDKPFICKNKINVVLIDFYKDKTYRFTIPKDYRWDGASIPRAFWRIIGSKENPKFLIPSMIHDVICENHHYVGNDRYFADRVFEKLLKVSGVCAFKRWAMFHTVDNFQKFCGWKNVKGR